MDYTWRFDRPTVRLFESGGLPLVELTIHPVALTEMPPATEAYYAALADAYELYCREVLLPARAAAYERSEDPRKRFTFRRLCLALKLEGSVSGGYLSVRRRTLLRCGIHTAECLRGEVFRLCDGLRMPLAHFTGRHARALRPKHPRLRPSEKRGDSYVLQDNGILLFTTAGEVPVFRRYV